MIDFTTMRTCIAVLSLLLLAAELGDTVLRLGDAALDPGSSCISPEGTLAHSLLKIRFKLQQVS